MCFSFSGLFSFLFFRLFLTSKTVLPRNRPPHRHLLLTHIYMVFNKTSSRLIFGILPLPYRTNSILAFNNWFWLFLKYPFHRVVYFILVFIIPFTSHWEVLRRSLTNLPILYFSVLPPKCSSSDIQSSVAKLASRSLHRFPLDPSYITPGHAPRPVWILSDPWA